MFTTKMLLLYVQNTLIHLLEVNQCILNGIKIQIQQINKNILILCTYNNIIFVVNKFYFYSEQFFFMLS
jgi:hypothetical protein